jgi:hypothetical protein
VRVRHIDSGVAGIANITVHWSLYLKVTEFEPISNRPKRSAVPHFAHTTLRRYRRTGCSASTNSSFTRARAEQAQGRFGRH